MGLKEYPKKWSIIGIIIFHNPTGKVLITFPPALRRLTEVTSLHLSQSFPRLTSAQASLRLRRRGTVVASREEKDENAKKLSPEETEESLC